MNSGIALTAVAAALFGIGGVVAADAFATVDPTVVAQYRSVVAALLMGLVAYRSRQTMTAGRLPLLGVFGAVIAAVTITFYWSIERLGVGPGVTIQFLAAIPVLIWMRFAQGRRVVRTAWVAAVAAIAGTTMMMRAWDASAVDPVGVLAGLGAMTFFAAYLLIGEHLRRLLPALTVVAYGFAVSALLWVVVLPPRLVDVDSIVWTQLIWVGVMGTAVPFLLMVTALGRADSGSVGVVATLEPVVAATAAWIFLDQSLSTPQVLGGLLVVVAIGVIQRTTTRVPSAF